MKKLFDLTIIEVHTSIHEIQISHEVTSVLSLDLNFSPLPESEDTVRAGVTSSQEI